MITMKTYELYNGPLDGEKATPDNPIKEGWELSLDLVKEEFTPEIGQTVTKVCHDAAVYVMTKGKLVYKGTTL